MLPIAAVAGQSGVLVFSLHADVLADARLSVANLRFLDEVPLMVAAPSFSHEAPARVEFALSEDPTGLSASTFNIHNLSNGTSLPPESVAFNYDQKSNTARLTFPTYSKGVLPDGKYRMTLSAVGVTDLAGNALPADFTFDFTVLTGDANGDGSINADDYSASTGGSSRSRPTRATARATSTSTTGSTPTTIS